MVGDKGVVWPCSPEQAVEIDRLAADLVRAMNDPEYEPWGFRRRAYAGGKNHRFVRAPWLARALDAPPLIVRHIGTGMILKHFATQGESRVVLARPCAEKARRELQQAVREGRADERVLRDAYQALRGIEISRAEPGVVSIRGLARKEGVHPSTILRRLRRLKVLAEQGFPTVEDIGRGAGNSGLDPE